MKKSIHPPEFHRADDRAHYTRIGAPGFPVGSHCGCFEAAKARAAAA